MVKCWRKTLHNKVEALILVSSIRIAFRGSIFSSSLASRGNSTLLKQASHSIADSVWSSCTSSARWRYCRACMRTSPFVSQLSLAMPCKIGHQHLDHKFETTESMTPACWDILRCSSAQIVNIDAALVCNVSKRSSSFICEKKKIN